MKIYITLMLVMTSFHSMAQTELILGTAKNRQGELQYTEHHTMTYDGNLLSKVETHYFNVNGQEFASLISEFTGNSFLPNSTFKDLRTNESEITQIKNNDYVLTTIDKNGKKKSDSLKIESNMLCGQGYHNYLRAHLNDFKLNEEKEIKFVLPSRRDYYSFDLPLIKMSDNKKTFKLAITN